MNRPMQSSICYDENGKVVKPEGWKHPDKEIKEIIDRMRYEWDE